MAEPCADRAVCLDQDQPGGQGGVAGQAGVVQAARGDNYAHRETWSRPAAGLPNSRMFLSLTGPGGGGRWASRRVSSKKYASVLSRHQNGGRGVPAAVPVLSDAPERLRGGQACGADGGQQPGQGADDDSRGQAAGPGLGRDDDGLAMAAGVGGGGGRADDDADDAAGQGQQDRLGEELGRSEEHTSEPVTL